MNRIALAIAAITIPAVITAQNVSSFPPAVQAVISVPETRVALQHVRVVDGTGKAPLDDQTILIDSGKIVSVGPAASAVVPAGVRVMDLSGHTVIPGIVGMHNHTFYTTRGRSVQLQFTAPRLYLGSGITTIRTTGGTSPYHEINMKKSIDRGEIPGPRMHLTGPYLTGPGEIGRAHV